MEDGTAGRRSQVLVLASFAMSAISLFIVLGGLATAGGRDGKFTGADIKDGSLDTEDFAKASVNTGVLAPGSVKYAQFGILAEARVSATNVETDEGALGCVWKLPAEFTTVERNVANVFSPSEPANLRAPRAGVYTVNVSGTWESGAGDSRGFGLLKVIGSGPNAGQRSPVDFIKEAPAGGTQSTVQSWTVDVQLSAGDSLQLQPIACGADVDLSSLSFAMRWTR